MRELDDEQLFEALRSAVAFADPVPDEVLQAARMCLTWQSVDSDLARLDEPGPAEDGPGSGLPGA
jgi:hypothetical protein